VTPVTGGCLCGAVRYEVRGPLRDVVICHCQECLRWHGAPCAASAAYREHLVLTSDEQLRWIDSPASASNARRGFCGACGSSLFWDAPGRPTVSIAAGTLDQPTGLRVIAHVYTESPADWDVIPEDGLPHHPGGGRTPPPG
jgi:hypothetical protein